MTGRKVFENLVKLNERLQQECELDSFLEEQEYSGIKTRLSEEKIRQLDFVYTALLPVWDTELSETTLAATLSIWHSYDRKICNLIQELLTENDDDKLENLLSYYGLEDYDFDMVKTPIDNKLLSIAIAFSNPSTARYDLMQSQKDVRQMELFVRKVIAVRSELMET